MRASNETQLARSLGWFSLGLGVAEVAASRRLANMIGLRGDHDNLLRTFGAREILSGVGILSQRGPSRPLAAWLWSRVCGDAMDLAFLGAALASGRSNRRKVAAATAAVAGVTALDVLCARKLSRLAGEITSVGAIHVVKSITINRPVEELYSFWRNFQNLPRFMKHLVSVQVSGDKRSRWVAKGPAGSTVEWDAEIFEDRPNELIAWRSLEGSDVDSAGTVRFERGPGGRGTVVRVNLQYRPPAGLIGRRVSELFGEGPEWQIKDDLRRFKQVMEAGEVITTEGQPAGRPSSVSWRYDRAVKD
jgi:uncharacterized membrane protein